MILHQIQGNKILSKGAVLDRRTKLLVLLGKRSVALFGEFGQCCKFLDYDANNKAETAHINSFIRRLWYLEHVSVNQNIPAHSLSSCSDFKTVLNRLARLTPTYQSFKKSTVYLKSSMVYSLFISCRTQLDADCTGIWRKE